MSTYMDESEESLLCPVCNVPPDLAALVHECVFGSGELTSCCEHLVPTMEFGTVADDLARACGGQMVWYQIRAGMPHGLKEEWQRALEDEGASHDLEGEYFIAHFVEACATVVRVDRHYDTVGGVGTASNVCTPFVWVKDRTLFAQELLEQLNRAAAPAAK